MIKLEQVSQYGHGTNYNTAFDCLPIEALASLYTTGHPIVAASGANRTVMLPVAFPVEIESLPNALGDTKLLSAGYLQLQCESIQLEHLHINRGSKLVLKGSKYYVECFDHTGQSILVAVRVYPNRES